VSGLVDGVVIATPLGFVAQGQGLAGARAPAQQGGVRAAGQQGARVSVKRATGMVAGGGV